jgi:peptidoglycan/LPS O-acetylase OafA/YrhL
MFIRFLEWKGFVITTKFCYAFYLIQIPIFQLSIANTKDIRYYTVSSMINLNELFGICAASVLMTLFIETPFNNIKKLLFARKIVDENSNIVEEKKEKMK